MNATYILNEYKKKMAAGKKGFTLVELLVVIAVIGILATVIILAINPLEQLARTRDSGRKSNVAQISNALQAYYTAHDGKYPAMGVAAPNGPFITSLVLAGEVKQAPSTITYGGSIDPCTIPSGADRQSDLCYVTSTTNDQFVLYTRLESDSERTQVSAAVGNSVGGTAYSGVCPDTADGSMYFAYSSASGKSCRVCVGATSATSLAADQTCN